MNCYKQEQDSPEYIDLYYLVHNWGVPDELRSKIWREFFKVQILEEEEIGHFKNTLGEDRYDTRLTVYQNYKQYASNFDCLAFSQIDEDVGLYTFP